MRVIMRSNRCAIEYITYDIVGLSKSHVGFISSVGLSAIA